MTFVFAARLVEGKGALDVARAARYLRRYDIRIEIYGIGPLRDRIARQIRDDGVDHQVKLMGEVSIAELLRAYRRARAFVMPTYFVEGFPMALFYAVACGLPIVTTPVRAMKDHLLEPDNCLWVEPRNPEMLARRLEMLVLDEGLHGAMVRNNFELAKRFSPELVAERFIDLYASLGVN